jgi:acetolactate synthase-1/2/3 large subunit
LIQKEVTVTEERSGAQILVESLVRQDVEFVFGYPGGAVLPIYDALFGEERLRHILVRHEAGAAHAAEGYARSTGKPGVVLVTSGPARPMPSPALPMLSSIDSAGGHHRPGRHPLIGSDAFQEADTVGITRHCCKHNYLVKDPANLAAVIDEAFQIATTGRPGPVVIDIPKDVQIATAVPRRSGAAPQPLLPQLAGGEAEIAQAIELIAKAKAPVFYTGGGVINSGPVPASCCASCRRSPRRLSPRR